MGLGFKLSGYGIRVRVRVKEFFPTWFVSVYACKIDCCNGHCTKNACVKLSCVVVDALAYAVAL